MVLGNFALLFGVQPQRVDSWFLEAFVDALPWVVTPNVVAMSQFADMGRITSKPYISGGAYVSRMGDDCTACDYDPKVSVGDRACPFTTLYWDFIARHADRFAKDPRMARQVAAARKLADLDAVRARAARMANHLRKIQYQDIRETVVSSTMTSGTARMVTYDLTADDDMVWGLGLVLGSRAEAGLNIVRHNTDEHAIQRATRTAHSPLALTVIGSA